MYTNFIFRVLFFCCLLSNVTLAQETMVTEVNYAFLEKLISTAKENYPRVKSFQNRINIAKSNITQSQLSWFDAVRFSYVYQPNNTLDIVNPNFFNGYQIGLSLNLGTVLKNPSQIKKSKEELKIANNEQQEYDITITTLVKERYFIYLQYLAILRLQTTAVQDASSVLKSVKYQYEKSEETFTVYNQALLSLTQFNSAKIQAETNLFIAKSNLEELINEKLENIN